MLGGLLLVPLVSLLTKKPDAAQVDSIFRCYDKTTTVPVKESLGE